MSKPRNNKVIIRAMTENQKVVTEKILKRRERLTFSEAEELKMLKIDVLLRWLTDEDDEDDEISKIERTMKERDYNFVSDLCLANDSIWKSFGIPKRIEVKMRSVADSVIDCAELHSPTPGRKNKRNRSEMSTKIKRASEIASRLDLGRREKSFLQTLLLAGGRQIEDALLRFESGNLEPIEELLRSSTESTSKRLHETLSNQMSIDMDALSLLGSNGGSFSKEAGSLGGSFGVADGVEDPKSRNSLQSRNGSRMLSLFLSLYLITYTHIHTHSSLEHHRNRNRMEYFFVR